MQFDRGECLQPLHFSPCSRFLAVYNLSGAQAGLHILNEELRTLFTAPEKRGWLRRGGLHWAWTPSSSCIIVTCPYPVPDEPLSHSLEAVWHAHEPHDGSGDDAVHTNAMLAGFSVTEVLQHLSCSPLSGLAVVTQAPTAHKSRPYGVDHKLYILQPGKPAHSMAIAEKQSDKFLWGHAAWSPMGQHLLLCSESAVELVTSSCKLVRAFGRPMCTFEPQDAAIFHPGGRHVAVCCDRTLQVCRVRDGAMLMCVAGELHCDSQLSFSHQGHQLRLFGGKVHVISFGQDQGGCSQQACNAVVSACSSMPADEDDYY